MEKSEILSMFDDLLELDAGTLKGDESLAELNWNSLAIIGFIAMADEKYQIALSPKDIINAKTINELIGLINN